jgi:PKD repeat protein
LAITQTRIDEQKAHTMMNPRFKAIVVLAAGILPAACTVSSTPPPPLQGPSEFAMSLAMSANPEVLSLDGSSQSLVTVEARDANGQLAANVPLRLEILADGQAVDFGTLSARTTVTGTNGRAAFTYTAPMDAGGDIPQLNIRVTPTGSGDAANQIARSLQIRLMKPGVIVPGGVTASFTITPETPAAFTDVLFNASASTAPIGVAIVSYRWSFGDGSTGSGVSTSHRFVPGTFTVTLTTTDSNGLSASMSQLVVIPAGTAPTAVIVFSPTEPVLSRPPVFFNAGQSTPATSRRIVSYRWNFGDGETATGVTTSHTYAATGTYVVVLRVTDDVGQVGTASAQVEVLP